MQHVEKAVSANTKRNSSRDQNQNQDSGYELIHSTYIALGRLEKVESEPEPEN
jgi:hypothetical protein